MNDYTLFQIARDKQRDTMRERDNDRLVREAEETRKEAETHDADEKRQSLVEIFANYLPKKPAIR